MCSLESIEAEVRVGTFTYGPASIDVEFEDRLLAHLRAVIVTKLRRTECFLFTWNDTSGPEEVQRSLWMHPSVGMRFELSPSAAKPLNRAWVELLTSAANSDAGLTVLPEPKPA